MSPLKIQMLLRLHCYVFPFEGYLPEQIYAPAMREAFDWFITQDLIRHDVTIESARIGRNTAESLTGKGLALVGRICAVEP